MRGISISYSDLVDIADDWLSYDDNFAVAYDIFEDNANAEYIVECYLSMESSEYLSFYTFLDDLWTLG